MNQITRNRSFREAIVDIITINGPTRTGDFYPKIQARFPELCNDEIRDFSGGIDRGPAWKHAIRAAQEALKAKKLLRRSDDGCWHVTEAT